MTAQVVPAQTAKLDDLFSRLQATANTEEARRIEQEIWIEWSKSGSAAMDLLLERGRRALDEGQTQLAVEHFTALTDHAPDFAEGWNARATAYYSLGQFGPAISDIGRTLELNPRHYGALSGLAIIFEALGQPEKALEVYRKVLEIDPHAEGVPEAVTRLEEATLGQGI
ncbi:MAG: tetratricopeptide repeat protein [Rhodobacteraceae bacterium]|nr:tetratricopeptide repeat protein [Paracoccaceae bacterium]